MLKYLKSKNCVYVCNSLIAIKTYTQFFDFKYFNIDFLKDKRNVIIKKQTKKHTI